MIGQDAFVEENSDRHELGPVREYISIFRVGPKFGVLYHWLSTQQVKLCVQV